MDFPGILNSIIAQLTTLGNAVFNLVKILLGIFVTIFEFLADLIRRVL